MNSLRALIPFTSGIAAHVLYFHHGEHHMYPLQILKTLILASIASILIHIQYLRYAFITSITSTSLLLTLFLTGLFTSLTIYRLFFNPLNNIPGNYFSRLTRLDIAFRVFARHDSHMLPDRLHKQYGPYVRVGPNDISTTDPEAAQIIYGIKSTCEKAAFYDADAPLTSLWSARKKDVHAHKRRVWGSGFSDRALRGYESRINVYNDIFVEKLKELSGKPVDASKWFSYYSFDVMGDLAFGKSFDMLVSGKDHWAVKLLHDGLEPFALALPAWIFRLLLSIPALTVDYRRFIAFCGDQIDARAEKQAQMEEGKQDIAHFLIQDFEEQKQHDKMAHESLQIDSRLVIVAGSDTTASALIAMFHYLAKDSEIVRKLREEVEMIGELSNVKLKDAVYLNGCINEALRLHPAVPSGAFRKTPKEGVIIGKRFIQGNTNIQMPGYAMARDETQYPLATQYLPERWSTHPELVRNKDDFQPFLIGPRNCIGKNIALMEMRSLTAQLVLAFDIKFAPGETGRRVLEESKDHFTMEMAPLELVFTVRA